MTKYYTVKRTLKVNTNYYVQGVLCKLIRVTEKGYAFLRLDSNILFNNKPFYKDSFDEQFKVHNHLEIVAQKGTKVQQTELFHPYDEIVEKVKDIKKKDRNFNVEFLITDEDLRYSLKDIKELSDELDKIKEIHNDDYKLQLSVSKSNNLCIGFRENSLWHTLYVLISEGVLERPAHAETFLYRYNLWANNGKQIKDTNGVAWKGKHSLGQYSIHPDGWLVRRHVSMLFNFKTLEPSSNCVDKNCLTLERKVLLG